MVLSYRQLVIWMLGSLILLAAFTVSARGVYQEKEPFLAEAFGADVPASQALWLKGELRDQVTALLGHPYLGLRIRYWQQEERTAWILEEVGKEQAITFGLVVKHAQIEKIKVLEYRESRGDEVRYPAFTQQFKGAKLQQNKLDRHIDGISGATLSVGAMITVAKLALYLNSLVIK